jgi:hypothetical protein
MLLTVKGTPYEIDTARLDSGKRWIQLWENNKLIGGYASFEKVIESIHTLCDISETEMARRQSRLA